MNIVAQFKKVSLKQFTKDWQNTFPCASSEDCKFIYDSIKLPSRATKGSAGYDFFAPTAIALSPGKSITIPTGIRVFIEDGWVLKCYPRSGLGSKFRLQLNNTVGIIDSKENKSVAIKEQTGFVQGIFVPFGITIDDTANAERNGGFGSTTA